MINALVGVLAGWLAICFFGAFAFTSPKRGRWLKFPIGVRLTFIPTALAFMARSVELITLESANAAGSASLAGLFTSASLSITVTSLLVWGFVLSRLEPQAWDRVRWALDQIKLGMVPVMVPPAQAGLMATDKPNDILNGIPAPADDAEIAAVARELAARGEVPELPQVVRLHS